MERVGTSRKQWWKMRGPWGFSPLTSNPAMDTEDRILIPSTPLVTVGRGKKMFMAETAARWGPMLLA